MNTKLLEAATRVTNSITRVPDRLSTPDGESIRTEYARIFGKCIAAGLANSGGLYLDLPFQASLLTDPVMFATHGALVVLDHPTRPEQYEFIMNKVHILHLNKSQSLYQGRYPRLIYIPTERKEWIKASVMANRLSRFEFRGPFAKEIM